MWWSNALELECAAAADDGWPNEVCGLLWLNPGQRSGANEVRLRLLPSEATPTSFQASPESVVTLTYDAMRHGAQIVATFHSHPTGALSFSTADDVLTLTADVHVLYVRNHDGRWQPIFGRSTG